MLEDNLAGIADDLNHLIEGEAKVDLVSRLLYSTDGSIYQVLPLGVVIPKSQDDLEAVVSYASKWKIPILPRGSGSSLAGQTVGEALVIDCSTYLNKIINIDPETKTAVVEPGVVLNTFNYHAAKHGQKYGPDPASADRATFGGMMGNNSTGAHSILYGMTSDNVIEMNVLLSDGMNAKFESLTEQAMKSKSKGNGIEGAIYRSALEIKNDYEVAIKKKWPETWRRSSGYSLNYLYPWSRSAPPLWEKTNGVSYPPNIKGEINLAPLMVGSEGTLAVYKNAKVRLVESPPKTVLGILSFDSISSACDSAPLILDLEPSAIELIPQALIRRARAVPAYAKHLSFVIGDPKALLIVEFSGQNIEELLEQAKGLGDNVVIAENAAEQEKIWAVRKVGLGLLMSRPGDSKPLPFVEDVAVPVERLGEFVRGFENIMEELGTEGDFYAHVSAGCLHIRPLINLKERSGSKLMRDITAEIVNLTVQLGGALSGEHGDGLARSEWLENIYGSEIIEAFAKLKNAADPNNILNPGKIVQPPRMEENLRYGENYKIKPWQPVLDFQSQENFSGAIEMCNGAGVCRKASGVMCPSFQATQDEMHSTRGRANLLRAMISGKIPSDKIAKKAVFEALDLCLECKGCKAECPSGVDMGKLKYEFLNNYYNDNRRPISDYFFAFIGEFSKAARPFSGISNLLLKSKSSRKIIELVVGISANRNLPVLKKAFDIGTLKSNNSSKLNQKVILLRDPFSEYYFPELLKSAVKILNAVGCKVHILGNVGAGRTLISKGFLEKAKKNAMRIAKEITAFDLNHEFPIIGLEPSDIFTLRDEFLDLFPEDDDIKKISERVYMIDEFLVRPDLDGEVRIDKIEYKKIQNNIKLHTHCYQKAQPPAEDNYPNGAEASKVMLEAAGFDVDHINSGCCGMAGSFGYESDHYEVSMQIGELALFPAIRDADKSTIIAAPGVSCRAQIESGTDRTPVHPITLIADSIR